MTHGSQPSAFVERAGVSVLNIAGPRASKWPGARDYAYAVVLALIKSATEERG